MPDIYKVKVFAGSGGDLVLHKHADEPYIRGTVTTRWGLVRVYAQRDGWSLNFVWNGHCYQTSGECEQLPSTLALTRRASKFVRQIVEKNGDIKYWY